VRAGRVRRLRHLRAGDFCGQPGELMKRFSTYLKSGLTKDEALRHAQIDKIHSADFSQPKDWAAFQLNGDWK
jgi:CHAT domain-containing protein